MAEDQADTVRSTRGRVGTGRRLSCRIFRRQIFNVFSLAEFAEIVTVAGLVTTLFFGGWQVPYLLRDGFHFPLGRDVTAAALGRGAASGRRFYAQGGFFCWLQILLRWSVPRFRYDQVMRLGLEDAVAASADQYCRDGAL